MKSSRKPIRHLVGVSDLHIGCKLGLCQSSGAAIDEGGRYLPSDFQKHLWEMWQEFWRVWVPKYTMGEPYDVVVNGECIDGTHHNAVTQWTHNLAFQAAAAVEILTPVRDSCGGRLTIIRGTEAHSGSSGQWDEWIARELKCKPNKAGQHARYELWKIMNGDALVHCTHHIGTTQASAYESTAVYRELVEAYVESGRWNDRPPDVLIRSHRHRHFRIGVASARGEALAIVTPGWQGKTPFSFKLGSRQSQPQFGGVVITSFNKDLVYEQHKVWRLERPEAEI